MRIIKSKIKQEKSVKNKMKFDYFPASSSSNSLKYQKERARLMKKRFDSFLIMDVI
jgi:hypothetical protein